MRRAIHGIVAVVCAALFVCASAGISAAMRKDVISSSKTLPAEGEFNIIAEPFDWGKDVTRIMLNPGGAVTAAELNVEDFDVKGKHYSEQALRDDYNGPRKVMDVYPVDEDGNRSDSGGYVILELEYGSNVAGAHTGSYNYANFYTPLTLTYTVKWNGETYTQHEVVNLLCDEFVLDRYTDESIQDKEYNFCDYALYSPKEDGVKKPLIIFFHGMGEGGAGSLKNHGVQMYAYPEANFASEEIQEIMGGSAYVLLPQSPKTWPNNGFDKETQYLDVVNSLIDSVIEKNNDIDEGRIYVGGLSMGGYMASRVILNRPDKYAAAFLCAQAYEMTEDDAKKLKDLPIWVSCSEADTQCPMDPYTYASYVKLVEAGNIDAKCAVMERNRPDPTSRFRFYDNSADEKDFTLYYATQEHENEITGDFVWDNVSYAGHNGGWVGVFANGEFYENESGEKVTIMDWLASKSLYSGMELDTSKVKKAYTVGEAFTSEGLIVSAIDRNGGKVALNGYLVSADTSKEGTVKVTVSYGAMSATYDIVVSAVPVSTPSGDSSGAGPSPAPSAQPSASAPAPTSDVVPPAGSIKLSASSVVLFKKGLNKAVIRADVTGTGENVVWSSSDESVAVVNNGVITAKKAGTVVIKAVFAGAEASCKVTVKNAVFKVNKTSFTVKKGKSVRIKVTVSPKKAVRYKASSKAVRVNNKGVVKGIKKGSATVTVSYMGVKQVINIKVK